MPNPADANVNNPKTFTITPGPAVDGAPVDDYTIQFGPSDVNNTPPTSFVSVTVPAADLTPDANGNIVVPFPDVIATALKAGTYGAKSEADSGSAMSGDSPLVFFNITQAPPSAPVAFTVA